MSELFANLDQHASTEAWLIGCRIQYVHDKHLRDIDWWFRKVWRRNGCTVTLSKIKQVAASEDWPSARADLWDKVFYVIEERFAEEQAEHALTVVKKLKAIQAVMLEKLAPRVVLVTGPDGVVREELELQIQPKSYEGMVRGLKDILEMQSLVTQTALELISGSRGTEDLAMDVGVSQQESEADSTALGRLRSLDVLRRVANTLAIQDGKPEATT
jgi:hypothetical protein